MRNKKEEMELALDLDVASKILENVFEKSDVVPNTVPLEVLTAYSSYRKERFALQRTIIVIVMVLFLLLPMLFIAPSFTVTTADAETFTSTPSFNVSVEGFMPVARVTATIDGRNIPVYEVDAHQYSVEPFTNGLMKVSVTLINRQQLTHYVTVGNVDMESPVIVSNDSDGENIYLNLSDTGSGINFDKVKAIDTKGNVIPPVYCDESSGRIGFAYPEDSLNVYIEDNAGNTLQLVLSIK